MFEEATALRLDVAEGNSHRLPHDLRKHLLIGAAGGGVVAVGLLGFDRKFSRDGADREVFAKTQLEDACANFRLATFNARTLDVHDRRVPDDCPRPRPIEQARERFVPGGQQFEIETGRRKRQPARGPTLVSQRDVPNHAEEIGTERALLAARARQCTAVPKQIDERVLLGVVDFLDEMRPAPTRKQVRANHRRVENRELVPSRPYPRGGPVDHGPNRG